MTSLLALIPLATPSPDPADVKPGWLGFTMFLALAVAVVLLWLSMRRQLKKIDFVEEPDEPAASVAPDDAGHPGSRAGDPTQDAGHRSAPPAG